MSETSIEVRVALDELGNMIAQWQENDEKHKFTIYSEASISKKYEQLLDRLDQLETYEVISFDFNGYTTPREYRDFIEMKNACKSPRKRWGTSTRRNIVQRTKLAHPRRTLKK